ncbi:MAG: molybdopterin-binding protein [Sphaerochaeta sp.]|jgi:molybdopterin biosynthesis enzyme|nr:molybdopterin-binding protein [Sphaerochaeta sp.]MCH3921181.1 molybdopterin-binding protein [Sphaerochaeta sp.]MCI2045443.1 molybdopterin-binding protein [Sphaerochaeta sp.]MCI2097316.1 molybdopterin-binding protein [Sphaerochaeta sp.]
MKLVRTEDAVGQVLCHDMTQIIVGVTKDARFRKGHVVTNEDIPVLLSMGKEHLYVWEMDDTMLHEDDGAAILRDAAMNQYMDASLPKEGKIELKSNITGVLEVDVQRLLSINRIPEVMIATRPNHSVVKPGDKLAGMRVIPLVIPKGTMRKVAAIADKEHPILSIHPFAVTTCAIIVTGEEVRKGLITDTFSPVVSKKLQNEFGIRTLSVTYGGDDAKRIGDLIAQAREEHAGMILCTGGMSVDPDDRTPKAIADSGARVVRYGFPVLPGAMCMLGYFDGGVPIVGLPGCVMYAKRTVFDVLLPRLVAGIPITAEDISAMGDGGLCLGCDPCVYPICAFGKGGL